MAMEALLVAAQWADPDGSRHGCTAVRPDIGRAGLAALLSGLLMAMRPRTGADSERVLSVFRDGLRPQART